MSKLPVARDVYDAYERVKAQVIRTPLIRNAILDERAGRPVFVKCEPLQHTGSFKFRGAYNRLVQLSEEQREKGVVAFSSGNHAQGIARAARLLRIKAKIVMPKDTPKVKIEGVQNDGAEIIFYDRYTESREKIAADISLEDDAVLVPSYDDPHIIAGQGSCGVEITQQYDYRTPPSKWVCCVGGGGLIAGTSLALKDKWPDIDVWGVEPEHYDDHERSLRAGRRIAVSTASKSICDAILTPQPGEMTFAINKKLMSGVATISDEEAKTAVRFAFRYLKIVLEPGGAAALAAVLSGKVPNLKSGPICLILSGGNIDPDLMSELLATA